MRIIDVSEHQGTIDWDAAAGSVDAAMLRAGYGRGHADGQFARNAAECARRGIPWGAYWFSYACTAEDAAAEAGHLLRAAEGRGAALPLAFDFEYDSAAHAARCGTAVTPALVGAMAQAFCARVEAAGRAPLIYANPDFLARYYAAADLPPARLWLACWRTGADLSAPPRACAMWQWTNRASVPGIRGDVDMSEGYGTWLVEGKADTSSDLASLGHLLLKEKAMPWYAEAMAWAEANGILTDGRPADFATRAEVAQMLFNLSEREKTQ